MAVDIAGTELSKEMQDLTLKTCEALRQMTFKEFMIRKKGKTTNLQNYMLNESMILLQFVESVLNIYKQMMAQSYDRTARHLDDRKDLK